MSVSKYAMLAVICLYSCTGVSSGEMKDPEGSSLSINFDFSHAEVKPETVPENMEVFMADLLNGYHYRFNEETGFVIEKEGEFPIKGGDYSVISVGSDSCDFEIVGADSFMASENPTGLSQLYICLSVLSDREVAERYCPGLNNMSSAFFSVPPVPRLYLSNEKIPIYFNESGEQHQVTLTPSETGMTLKFVFHLQVEDSVVVDSVFAGISGVPVQLNLEDCSVTRDSLGKSFFKMNPYSSQTAGPALYVGEVKTWGVFSADSENEKNGSGVLWVSATVSCGGKSVIYGTGVNLKRMIDSIGIMESDDRVRWKSTKKEALFDIDRTYFISREMISSSGKDRATDWIQIGDGKDSIIVEM